MGKNITIVVLIIISLGFLIFGFYQKTLSEKARHEVEVQQTIAEQCAENAQKAQRMAVDAMEEAHKQRTIAEQALQAIENSK